MQEALTKFRAKCKFLEKAYAQLIAMDAASFERYKEGEDFDRFFRRVLALGKESEAHTFDETAGNIMVLCAGATSDSFRRELRLKGRALTLENIQELADDSRRAEKEEQDMNALRDEHVRAVGKGGARQKNSQNGRNRGQTSGKRPCNRCGKDNHTTSECTIPRSVKCSKCEKLGLSRRQTVAASSWRKASSAEPGPTGGTERAGRCCSSRG